MDDRLEKLLFTAASTFSSQTGAINHRTTSAAVYHSPALSVRLMCHVLHKSDLYEEYEPIQGEKERDWQTEIRKKGRNRERQGEEEKTEISPSWSSHQALLLSAELQGSGSSVERKGCGLLEQLHGSCTNRNSVRRQEQLVFNPGEHGWKLLMQRFARESPVFQLLNLQSTFVSFQQWPNDKL